MRTWEKRKGRKVMDLKKGCPHCKNLIHRGMNNYLCAKNPKLDITDVGPFFIAMLGSESIIIEDCIDFESEYEE